MRPNIREEVSNANYEDPKTTSKEEVIIPERSPLDWNTLKRTNDLINYAQKPVTQLGEYLQGDISKYDADIPKEKRLDAEYVRQYRADAQSGLAKVNHMVLRGAIGSAVAAHEIIATPLDLIDWGASMVTGERAYDNFLTKGFQDVEESARKEMPIYTDEVKPFLFGKDWFLSNGDQAIRSVGYFAPQGVLFKGIGLVVKALKLGQKVAKTAKIAKLMDKTADATKLVNKTEDVLTAFGSASIMNWSEHLLSATDHFGVATEEYMNASKYSDEQINESASRIYQGRLDVLREKIANALPEEREQLFKEQQSLLDEQASYKEKLYSQKKYTEAQARDLAAEEASGIVWGGKINMIYDTVEQLALFGGLKGTRRFAKTSIGSKVAARAGNLAKVGIPEYLEEVTTGYYETEAEREMKIRLGEEKDDGSTGIERFIEHLGTYEGITEGALGFMGGAGMSVIAGKRDRRVRSAANNRMKENAALMGDSQKFNKLQRDSFYDQTIDNAKKGTMANWVGILKEYQTMTEKEAVATGLIDEGDASYTYNDMQEKMQSYVEDAERIEAVFNEVEDKYSKMPHVGEMIMQEKIGMIALERDSKDIKKEIDIISSKIDKTPLKSKYRAHGSLLQKMTELEELKKKIDKDEKAYQKIIGKEENLKEISTGTGNKVKRLKEELYGKYHNKKVDEFGMSVLEQELVLDNLHEEYDFLAKEIANEGNASLSEEFTRANLDKLFKEYKTDLSEQRKLLTLNKTISGSIDSQIQAKEELIKKIETNPQMTEDLRSEVAKQQAKETKEADKKAKADAKAAQKEGREKGEVDTAPDKILSGIKNRYNTEGLEKDKTKLTKDLFNQEKQNLAESIKNKLPQLDKTIEQVRGASNGAGLVNILASAIKSNPSLLPVVQEFYKQNNEVNEVIALIERESDVTQKIKDTEKGKTEIIEDSLEKQIDDIEQKRQEELNKIIPTKYNSDAKIEKIKNIKGTKKYKVSEVIDNLLKLKLINREGFGSSIAKLDEALDIFGISKKITETLSNKKEIKILNKDELNKIDRYKSLLSILKPLVKDVNVYIYSDSKNLGLSANEGGLADYSNNIALNKHKAAAGYNLEVLSHELLHNLTVKGLDKDNNIYSKDFDTKITELFNIAKENINSKEYGLTNKLEFIAEVFSNPNFQAKLSNIKSGKNYNSNLFNDFVNTLKEFINKAFGRNIDNSLLKDTIGLVGQYIEEAASNTKENINAKYDAELAALKTTEQPKISKTTGNVKDKFNDSIGEDYTTDKTYVDKANVGILLDRDYGSDGKWGVPHKFRDNFGIDFDKVNDPNFDPKGKTVYFEVDLDYVAKQFEGREFDAQDAQVLYVIYEDGNVGNKDSRVVLGAVRGLKTDSDESIVQLRDDIFDEIGTTGTGIKRYSVTTKVKSKLAGKIWNTPTLQKIADVLKGKYPMVFGIATTANSKTSIQFPGVEKFGKEYLNIRGGQDLDESLAGYVFMAVPGSNGNMLPIMINTRKVKDVDPSVLAKIKEILNRSTNEDWKAVQEDLRDYIFVNYTYFDGEIRLKDDKGKIVQRINMKDEVALDQWLKDQVLQVDLNSINGEDPSRPNYNEEIAEEGWVKSDLNPEQFTNSTAFEFEKYTGKEEPKPTEKKQFVDRSAYDSMANPETPKTEEVEDMQDELTDIDAGDDINTGVDDILFTGEREPKLRGKDHRPYKQWNKVKELAYLNRILPSDIPITIDEQKALSRMLNMENFDGYGAFYNAGIYILNTANQGTAYHEAFHTIFSLYLTKKQQDALLKNNTEEELADMFMDYKLSGGKAVKKTWKDHIVNFFKGFYNLITKLSINTVAPAQLFDAIDSGKYVTKSPLNNGYVKGMVKLKRIPGFSQAEKKRRIESTNVTFFKVLDDIRDNNKKFNDFSDIELLNEIGVERIYKFVYKKLFKTFKQKGMLNDPLVKKYLKNLFDKEGNAKLLTREAALHLQNFGINVPVQGDVTESYDINDENPNLEVTEEEGIREGYFSDKETRNSKETVRQNVKKALRTTYLLDKDGSVRFDDLGLPYFIDYHTAYNSLEKGMSDLSTRTEMMDKIDLLAVANPSLKDFKAKLEGDQMLMAAFVSSMQMSHANHLFISQFRDSYESHGRTIHQNKFVTHSANRSNVDQLVIDRWKNNLDYKGSNEITDDKGNISTEITLGIKKQFKALTSNLETSEYTLEHFNQLSEILEPTGITISPIEFESAYVKDEKNFKTLMDGLEVIINGLALGKNPYDMESGGGEMTSLRKAAKAIGNAQMDLFQSSFKNTDNKTVYAHILSSFLSKQIKRVKDKETRDDFMRTDFFKDSVWMNALSQSESVRESFNYALFNGVKLAGQFTGTKYSKLDDVTYNVAMLGAFFNSNNKSNVAYFKAPIMSDSTTLPLVSFKKYRITENNATGKNDMLQAYYKVAVQEAHEIRKRKDQMDKDGLNEDKYIKNYHSDKIQYNFLKVLNEPGVDINNEEDTINRIEKWLNEQVRLKTEELTSLKIIGNKESKNNLIDSRITNQQAFVKDYVWNSIFANIQMMQMFSGSLAYYEGNVDGQKRMIQVNASGVYLDTSAEYEGFKVNPYFGSVIINEKKIKAPSYDAIKHALNENIKVPGETNPNAIDAEVINRILQGFEKGIKKQGDAMAYITIDRYKEIMVGAGRWDERHENAYKEVKSNERLNREDIDLVMQPIKPHFYGFSLNKDINEYVPFQGKNMEFLLLPQFAERSTELKDILDVLNKIEGSEANLRGQVQFDSAVKVGNHGQADLNSLEDGKVHNLSNSDYKIQTELPEHHEDTTVLLSTQLRKYIISDLPQGEYMINGKKMSREDMIALYEDLVISELEEAYSNLEGRIGIPKDLRKVLIEEVRDRRFGDDMEQALDLINDTDFEMPLYHPLQDRRIQSLMISLFRNSVLKQKMPGGSFVRIANIGFDEKLKVVTKAGGLQYFECILPAWTKEAFRGYIDKDGVISPKMPKELLELIGFRVPGEGKHSSLPLLVKEFAPEASGGVIMMPPEAMHILGDDFDGDKFYVMTPNFKRTKDGVVKIGYLDDSNSTVEDRMIVKAGETPEGREIKQEYYKQRQELKDKIDKSWNLYSGKIGGLLQQNQISQAEIGVLYEALTENKNRIVFLQEERNILIREQDVAESPTSEDILIYKMFGKDISSPSYLKQLKEEIESNDNEVENLKSEKREIYDKIKTISESKYSRKDIQAKVDKKFAKQNKLVEELKGLPEQEGFELLNVLKIDEFEKLPITKQNSKKARQNKLLDIMRGILTDKKVFEQVITPSNFAQLITDVKAMRKLMKSEDTDIVTLQGQELFFNRNMAGVELKGILANMVSNQAMRQFTGIESAEAIKFDGKEITNISKEKGINGKYISNQLKQWVAAIMDNAKEPIAGDLNVNTFTADVLNVIIGAGYESRTATMFLSQPMIRNAVKLYQNKGGNFKAGREALREVRETLEAKVGSDIANEIKDGPTTGFNTSDLEKNIVLGIEVDKAVKDINNNVKEDDARADAIAKHNKKYKKYYEEQLRILDAFEVYKDTGTSLNKLTMVMKSDSFGGASLAHMEVYERNLADIKNDPNLKNVVEGLAKYKIAQAFTEEGINKPNKFMKKYFPYLEEAFKTQKTKIENMFVYNKKLSADEINYIDSSLMTYLVSGHDAFAPEYRADIINKFPEEFKKLSETNDEIMNNGLVKKLRFEPATKEGDPINRTLFRNNGSATSEEMQQVKDDWAALLGSSDEDVVKFGKKLVQYTYFSTGFMFGNTSFFHVVPVSFWKALTTEKSGNFNKYLKKILDESKYDFNLWENFYSQFKRNNYTKSNYVPRVNEDNSNITKIDDKGTIEVNANTVKDRVFILEDNERGIKFVDYIALKDKKEVFLYRYNGKKGGIATYVKEQPLGIPNLVVEYDMNRDAIASDVVFPKITGKKQRDKKNIVKKENVKAKKASAIAMNAMFVEDTKEDMEDTIYSKLGNKTKRNNVVIKSVYQKKGVEYAKSIGGEFSLRLNNTDKHFGNPFSSVKSEIAKGLTPTKNTKESVDKYIDWVLNSADERAVWIREQINSGKLKGKPIVYYKELNEPSHATALDYLINEHKISEQKDTKESKQARTIDYTPTGKTRMTYTIKGKKILNSKGQEVWATDSKDRRKVFANLAIKEGRAMVVSHNNTNYIINSKGDIISSRTGDLMKWDANNGNRKAIMAKSEEFFNELSEKDIDDIKEMNKSDEQKKKCK